VPGATEDTRGRSKLSVVSTVRGEFISWEVLGKQTMRLSFQIKANCEILTTEVAVLFQGTREIVTAI